MAARGNIPDPTRQFLAQHSQSLCKLLLGMARDACTGLLDQPATQVAKFVRPRAWARQSIKNVYGRCEQFDQYTAGTARVVEIKFRVVALQRPKLEDSTNRTIARCDRSETRKAAKFLARKLETVYARER